MTTRSLRARRGTALVALIVIGALGVVACGDDGGPEDYSASVRAGMLEGCVEDDADANLTEVCECTYDAASDEWTFADFEQMEERLADGDERLPDDLAGIIRDCIRTISAERD